MLSWSIFFLIIALVAAVPGFTTIAGAAIPRPGGSLSQSQWRQKRETAPAAGCTAARTLKRRRPQIALQGQPDLWSTSLLLQLERTSWLLTNNRPSPICTITIFLTSYIRSSQPNGICLAGGRCRPLLEASPHQPIR